MVRDLTILDGSTFFVTNEQGDTDADEASGFFFHDVRHLSQWIVLLDGQPTHLLTARPLSYYSARVVATLATARVGENPVVTLRRDRFVAGGSVHEDLVVENHSETEREVQLEVCFGVDFADLFEVKSREAPVGRVTTEVGESRVTYRFAREGYERGTEVDFTAPGRLEGGRIRFDLRLGPRERWQTCCHISPIVDGKVHRVEHEDLSIVTVQPDMPLSLEEWLQRAPDLETDWEDLRRTYAQSLLDLAALRFRPRPGLDWSLPAAGVPWFMALFGRDSLIAAYQALPFQPQLAHTTLYMLAELQATRSDDFHDADPGKILHELRRGTLTEIGLVPQSPYYGTHDATLLFLILLEEYLRWTNDLTCGCELEPAARAAITWMQEYGDLDGDGYLEYLPRSDKGLENHCWKDSWNSILFRDGRLARAPIATCEIQGYAYAACLSSARVARSVWQDEALAGRLEARAAALREQFNRDFWNEERGIYVLALDADKQQVDSTTSNMGQLLWTGIVDESRAERLADRLFCPDLFNGWGIRTMSSEDAGYNPIEYHDGTVWPHDTAFIAAGLARYGFRDKAARLARALIDAAGYFDYRLPEVFAGFAREETDFPVAYPTASRPQSWSSGAPLLLLRTLLGLDASEGKLRVDPCLPEGVGELRLRGVHFGGGRVDT